MKIRSDKNKKFLNRKKNTALAAMVVILAAGMMTGCRKGENEAGVSLLPGFGSNELFRVGSVSCSVPEYMVYLVNTQKQYEQVFGGEIWDVALGEMTLEENVKDTVLAKIAQIKTMSMLAGERGIEISQEQESLVQAAAAEYFGSLDEAEIAVLAVSQEQIAGLYREYALADMVYQQIIDSVDPEISDEEARTITVDQIHMKTYTIDSQGTRMEFSAGMKAEVEEDMYDILEFATEDGRDFTELSNKYNEADIMRWSFRRGEVDPLVEEAAFALATDEISDVIETKDGYYLLKCVSTHDKEQTDANKQLIIQQRKNETFGKEYDAYVENLSKKLNEKLWQSIELVQDNSVNTNDFFEIYEDYFHK